MRVLLVEDEALPAMLLAAMLVDLGHEVVGPIDSYGRALAAARDAEVDIAVLDVNLRGELCFPIADALASRGVPSVLATGYDVTGSLLDGRREPILTKPFSDDALKAVLAAAVKSGAGASR